MRVCDERNVMPLKSAELSRLYFSSSPLAICKKRYGRHKKKRGREAGLPSSSVVSDRIDRGVLLTHLHQNNWHGLP